MGWLDRVGRFIDDVLLLPDEVRGALEAAEEALAAGRPEESEALFLEVLAARPTLTQAAAGLAEARETLGDAEGAREALAEARALEPEDPELALWDARLALETGALDAAAEAAREAAYQLATRGGPLFAESCRVRALAEWRRGRPDRAARELRKGIAAVPEDAGLRALLVEATVDAGQLAAARVAAAGATPQAVAPDEALRVGEALARAGAPELARPWLVAAVEGGRDRGRVTLARLALAEGRLEAAERWAREAVARGCGTSALAVLAQVLAAAGRPREAAEVFAAAARGSDDPSLARAAARTAPLDDATALIGTADVLEALCPGDPAARANRLWVSLAAGAEGVPEGLDADDEPRGILGRARGSLRAGRALEALASLDAHARAAKGKIWASVDAPVAEVMRRDALRALWRGPGDQVDLPAAIDAVARFGRERGLAEVERKARALRDELDRPLLLGVLGEFNAGKSTLINAFIGAEVAPMGIVPTTATLNVLRGGAERRVRVVRTDGTTREGAYTDMASLLAQAEAQGTSAVDHCEIVLPSETLEKVWILDTPGTNALDPAHERLAREAAHRADVVLWVFDAAQAGKRSEGRLLQVLRAARRRVVPVLNKVDRLRPEDVTKVQSMLARSFEGEPAALPVSARRALAARVSEDTDAEADSGFTALMGALEARVFSRARALKQEACAGRLLTILDDALLAETTASAPLAATVAAAEARLARLASVGPRTLAEVDAAVRAFEETQREAFGEAAEEVTAFVRPRTHRFAEHGVDPEDRMFLREVLERRLATALEACRVDLEERLAVLLGETDASGEGTPPPIPLGPSVAGYWGYQRGLLAGGALRRFFEETLPRASLELPPLVDALARAGADPRAELAPALRDAVAEGVARMRAAEDDRLTRAREELESLRSDVFGPLRALYEVLAGVIRDAPGVPEGQGRFPPGA